MGKKEEENTASNFGHIISKFKRNKVNDKNDFVVYDDTIVKVDIKRERPEVTSNSKKTYTIDEAIEKLGFGLFQVKLAFLTGCAYMSDSMEMMVLSILAPALSCEWEISRWEKALLTTVVFIGMGASSTIWGQISDKHGRKIGLLLCTFFSLYFGVLSAVSPTLIWLMVLRCLVGFGIGGCPQAFTMFSEFSPKNNRAKCSILLSFFWPVGACLEVALAMFVMPTLGWRYLLGFTSIPLFIFGFFCFGLPESARYYMTVNQPEKAVKILERVAKANKTEMPEGTVEPLKVQAKAGKFMDLLSKEHRKNTIIIWLIWFSSAFSYYGIVLLTTELFERGGMCESSSIMANSTISVAESTPCAMNCLKPSDYKDLFYTTIAEFPGLAATVFLVDFLGRRNAIFVTLLGFSIFTMLINICVSRTLLVLFIFTARCFITATFQATYIYTPEYYPTAIRAIGMGAGSGMARVGAIITPFVAQVLLEASPRLAISLYAVTALGSGFLVYLLPETKGKDLKS